jgi:1,4-alpha-glucan branching enzyme
MAKAKSTTAMKPVRLVVRAEGARAVVVTGDFTNWTLEGIPLSKNGGGEWNTTLKLVPGEYQYRLRIDGEWQDDPRAERRVPNAYGTENCVLVVA